MWRILSSWYAAIGRYFWVVVFRPRCTFGMLYASWSNTRAELPRTVASIQVCSGVSHCTFAAGGRGPVNGASR